MYRKELLTGLRLYAMAEEPICLASKGSYQEWVLVIAKLWNSFGIWRLNEPRSPWSLPADEYRSQSYGR